MNLDRLKYFYDAVRFGSVSEAAKKNLLSQSAVSRAIQKLEVELGTSLLIHQRKHFQITEVGEAVFHHCQKIFAELEDLSEIVTSFEKEFRGRLRVGCNQAIASYIICPVLENLSGLHPNLEIQLILGNTDQIQHSLGEGAIDFGIVLEDVHVRKTYASEKLIESEFGLVRSPKLQTKFNYEDILVSRLKSGGMGRKLIDHYYQITGEVLQPKQTIPSWQVILDLALSGFGTALVPKFMSDDLILNNELRRIDSKVTPIPFNLVMIYRKDRFLPRISKPLIELIRKRFV